MTVVRGEGHNFGRIYASVAELVFLLLWLLFEMTRTAEADLRGNGELGGGDRGGRVLEKLSVLERDALGEERARA